MDKKSKVLSRKISKKLNNHYFGIILILIISGITLGIITKHGYLLKFDLAISHFIQAHQPLWFVRIMQVISLVEFGQLFIVLPLFFYFLKKDKKIPAIFILVAGLSWFLMRTLKILFSIPCPTCKQVQVLFLFHNLAQVLRNIHPNSFFTRGVCFPSGHVFDYTVLWGTIYTLAGQITDNKKFQKIIKILAIFLITSVGLSRISLGAHFATDVVAGYLFGFAWLLILKYIYFSIKI